MPLHDVVPYLGSRCQVMLRCLACGGTHTHDGTLTAGRGPGELQLGSVTFRVDQVRALVQEVRHAEQGADTTVFARQTVNLLLQGGFLLAALSALHRFAR